MKKNIIKLLLLSILCFALVFTFISCDFTNDDDDDENEECTEHIDDDSDGLCDECGDIIDENPSDVDDTDFVISAIDAIAYESYSVAYDAKPHSILFDESKLPSGVQVYYSTETEYTAVGSYTVILDFYYKGKLLEDSTKSATLTITKATYDMSGISLSGVTKTYDGNATEVEILGNLPVGVCVSYEYKNAAGETVEAMTDVGIYTAWAIFSGDISNYYAIAPISATVEIRRASVSGLVFKDKVIEYDGTPKSIYVENLPSDITVTYEGGGKVLPGVYTVTATFSESPNFESISPMTATMTIELSNPLDYPTNTLTYERVEGGYAVTGVAGSPSFIVIPPTYDGSAVVSIKSNAFRGRDNLEFVYIPSSVVNIGNAAFRDCTKLETLHIADFSVTVNDNGTLNTSGTSQLKTIGQQAFANTALRVVDLPDSIVAIGIGAFEGCDKIEKMTVPFIGGSRNSTHSYFAYLFGADMAETGYTKVSSALKSVIISNSATEIPAFAFYKIASLESVYIGRNVAKIGNNAFAYCSSLHDIYIPESVTTIATDTLSSTSPFWGCPDDFMIVIESSESASTFGKYFANLSPDTRALIISDKTYRDYCMNKDNYRVGA